ncbi:hypothetical protein HMPREF0201_02998 [Cedecea davisae DSM 4568]|uniref:Uncharacterized protein n=1 Tax=Cedecea davisae DSM 4568 TaxID=566551 RepID=S3IPV3_9ENTR|nr:hypothetical protein HMPREF0201_02998 [Cedecea davisae DSM 4568]
MIQLVQRHADMGKAGFQVAQQRLSGVGGHYRAAGAVEEADAKALLQPAHGMAQRRGGNPQFSGRQAKAFAAADSEKNVQIGELAAYRNRHKSGLNHQGFVEINST